MKSLVLGFALSVSMVGYAESGIGLNEFCDPLDTVYFGSTPLYDEDTATMFTLEQYLTLRGLNIYCDPIGTTYFGGTPLFDESTGEYLTREEYLLNKQWIRD